ncbi:Hsp70 family protein [Nocardia xishanensis]
MLAALDEAGTLEAATVRRSTVRFGGPVPRVGVVPGAPDVVADFADLASAPDPAVLVGDTAWSPADLVAVVATCLLAEVRGALGRAVLAYPAIYLDHQVALLREALDRAGAAEVGLTPEPLAVVAALASDTNSQKSETVLVYDLGASCLDLAVVTIDAEGARLAGRPLRSYDFGGRAMESAIARYGHDLTPDAEPVRGAVDAVQIADIRARGIRASLDVVDDCVAAAGIAVADLDRILLVGGASTPQIVGRVLAEELGLPIVQSSAPTRSAAIGAALLAAAVPAGDTGAVTTRRIRRTTAMLLAAVGIPAATALPLALLETDLQEGSSDIAAVAPGVDTAPPLDAHGSPRTASGPHVTARADPEYVARPLLWQLPELHPADRVGHGGTGIAEPPAPHDEHGFSDGSDLPDLIARMTDQSAVVTPSIPLLSQPEPVSPPCPTRPALDAQRPSGGQPSAAVEDAEPGGASGHNTSGGGLNDARTADDVSGSSPTDGHSSGTDSTTAGDSSGGGSGIAGDSGGRDSTGGDSNSGGNSGSDGPGAGNASGDSRSDNSANSEADGSSAGANSSGGGSGTEDSSGGSGSGAADR